MIENTIEAVGAIIVVFAVAMLIVFSRKVDEEKNSEENNEEGENENADNN